ncbi:HlyD family efflux transporter periplasmic adaptor subunit [Scytonema sp. UIC 10036]|uniref:ABC exporter membrane fusion protein n=1 Tax=Scytonema sp. UIC 10036 TaxID=2304196 RepID=UPI0012DA3CF0|nr:ABC exporter membrane fusion protein [Scytonema sp. UIC 10036]MUH01678.1 HlyD family efflux transporter periplasmic adaptor subunit [Scytonema sp. UIC 10036]
MALKISSKLPNQWTVPLILIATGITGMTAYYGISQFDRTTQLSTPIESIPTIQQIVALGRIEPAEEVIRVSAPVTLNNDRIAQLFVQRGSSVQAGQVIAILDSRDRLQETVLEAKEKVEVARAKLAQVQAGAKSGEIAAQKAAIARLQAQLQGEIATQKAIITRRQSELNIARAEYERYQMLYREGAESALRFDNKKLAFETARAQLLEAQANQNRTADTLRAQIEEAKATLEKITEVRPVDVRASQAEIKQATAAVKKAEADLKQAYIRAPMAGRILEIYAKPGETVGQDGIADLGKTDQMEVVAEVYQTDIGKIRPGQTAIITSESFPGELRGTVRQMGVQITQQKVFSNQPGENLDRRVVEVRISLNPKDSQQVANLTNLQVQAAIQL